MSDRLAFEEPMSDQERDTLETLHKAVWSLASDYADPQASAYVMEAAIVAAATKAGLSPRELLEELLANLPDEDPEWHVIAKFNPKRFH